jgi:hypothetical protein
MIEVGDVLVSVNGTLSFTPAYTSCTCMPSYTHATHAPQVPGVITLGFRVGV